MSQQHSVSRRSAIAGISAGSLGLLFGSHVSARAPGHDMGAASGGAVTTTSNHRLAGRWIATLTLPSSPETMVAVPTHFGSDGSAFMIFPGAGAARLGVQIQGVALGSWEPAGVTSGHFTVVQVLADLNGAFVGTATVDGFATLDLEGANYEVSNSTYLVTIRDAANVVTEQLTAASANPMRGFRMQLGNAGFADVDAIPPRSDDPRTPY